MEGTDGESPHPTFGSVSELMAIAACTETYTPQPEDIVVNLSAPADSQPTNLPSCSAPAHIHLAADGGDVSNYSVLLDTGSQGNPGNYCSMRWAQANFASKISQLHKRIVIKVADGKAAFVDQRFFLPISVSSGDDDFGPATKLEFHLLDSGEGSEQNPHLIVGFDSTCRFFLSQLCKILLKRKSFLEGDGNANSAVLKSELARQATVKSQLAWIARVDSDTAYSQEPQSSRALAKFLGCHHLQQTVPACFGVTPRLVLLLG